MARTPDLALSTTMMIQPGGWALPADPNSVWGGLLKPMAASWSAIETSMESLVSQVDPRQAVALLPDWEALLGPDPCGRDAQPLTVQQRQRLVYQRLTSRGGQTVAYFVGLAAVFGEAATVLEGGQFLLGEIRLGTSRMCVLGNQFAWLVTLAQTELVIFRLGTSSLGDRLGSFTPSLAECAIQHASPAHTNVVFNYSGEAVV